MALLYQLLPTHLALQPALSGRLTQSIPLNDASYSLSTDDTRSGRVPAQSTGSEQETVCSGLRWGGLGSRYLSLRDDDGPHLVHHILPASFKQHGRINHTQGLSCGETPVTANSTSHLLPVRAPNAVLGSEWSAWGQGRSQRALLLDCPTLAAPVIPPTHP